MGKVYTLDAGNGFLDRLAAELIFRAADDPLTLTRYTVILPTARAADGLVKAFERQLAGRALLLPRILPVNVLESLVPGLETPVSDLERNFVLTRLIRAARPDAPTVSAYGLAADLAKLYDEAEANGADLSRVAALAPDDLAEHWTGTVNVLAAVTEHLPKIIADRGKSSPAALRRAKTAELIDAWRNDPDAHVVIAEIGEQDEIRLNLLQAIRGLPHGEIILPVAAPFEDAPPETLKVHPSFFPARTLRILKARPEPWPDRLSAPVYSAGSPLPPRGRMAFIRELTLPASLAEKSEAVAPEATLGIHYLECAEEHEEAAAVALIARQKLEFPAASVLIVCPDRRLSRIIAASLRRFDIVVDDSSGVPLSLVPEGAAATVILQAALNFRDPAFPLYLADAAKNFLIVDADRRMRMHQAELHWRRRRERREMPPEWLELKERLAGLAETLAASKSAAAMASTHLHALETIAPRTLESEELRQVLTDIAEFGDEPGPVDGEDYACLLLALMNERVVRRTKGAHRRIVMLGRIESRLLTADRVILAGFSDANWHNGSRPSPWLNRAMRKEVGLPDETLLAALDAFDIAALFQAPEVFVTGSARTEGTLAEPSRYIMRLRALQKAGKISLASAGAFLAAARNLHKAEFRPCERPEPNPPPALRPRLFSPSGIDLWLASPYSFYAKYILGLKPLDDIVKEPSAADFGTAVHAALKTWIEQGGELHEIGLKVMEPFGFDILTVKRFLNIADWFLKQRHDPAWTERKISSDFQGFGLEAVVDRMERDGKVIDYKTGAVPKPSQVKALQKVQLLVEAMILDANHTPAAALEYWQLGKKIVPVAPVDELLAGWTAYFKDLLALFYGDFPAPYAPTGKAADHDDYRTLSRLAEWSVPAASDGDEANDE